MLGAVRTEFLSHGKVVDSLKRQLNAATNTIDKLGTRTRAMNRALRNVEAARDRRRRRCSASTRRRWRAKPRTTARRSKGLRRALNAADSVPSSR